MKNEPQQDKEDQLWQTDEIVMTALEAQSGCVKSIEVPGRGIMKIKLPGGLTNGKKIKLKGIMSGNNGESNDDMIMRVVIK